MKDLKQCLGALRLPRRNLNRFSNALEEITETTLCARGNLRRTSMCPPQAASMTDSDSRSSKHFGQFSSFLNDDCLFDEGFRDDEIAEDDNSESSGLLQATLDPLK